MKKILLTVVLGTAVVAGAQSTTPPAQPAPAQSTTTPAQPATGQAAAQPAQAQPAAPAAAPVIKDPAEYNAYVNAIQQTDANAKISGLEAFVTQYPNSVMKNQALEVLMGTYQQANNPKKTMETAQKLVVVDSCNERALALLAILLLISLHLLTLPLLALSGFIAVCGTVAYSVAAPALVPSLVPPRSLPSANARIELARTVAFASGPALGGVLVGWVGAAPAFGFAATLSVIAIVLLSGIYEPARKPAPASHTPAPVSPPPPLAPRSMLARFIAAIVAAFRTK